MSGMQKPTPTDIESMFNDLIQVMGLTKHAMTKFETELWRKVIEITPRERFEAFLMEFVISPQARYGAPKPTDAAQMLGMRLDPEMAYALVEQMVMRCGPYEVPHFGDPVLVQAIHNMGGWVRVNETMPSPEKSFDVRAFKERFTAALNQAASEVRIAKTPVEPLKAIGASVFQAPGVGLRGPDETALAISVQDHLQVPVPVWQVGAS